MPRRTKGFHSPQNSESTNSAIERALQFYSKDFWIKTHPMVSYPMTRASPCIASTHVSKKGFFLI
jgi:hypothetical protein